MRKPNPLIRVKGYLNIARSGRIRADLFTMVQYFSSPFFSKLNNYNYLSKRKCKPFTLKYILHFYMKRLK